MEGLHLKIILIFVVLISCSESSFFGAQETKKLDDDVSRVNQDAKCDALMDAASSGLALVNTSSPFIDHALAKIRGKIPADIEPQADLTSFETSRTGSEHIEFSFFVNDLKLCKYYAKASRIRHKFFIVGKLPPAVSPADVLKLEWNEAEKSLPGVLKKLEISDEKTPELFEAQKCVYLDKNIPKSAYEMTFDVEGLPYYAIASENEVFRAEGRFFEAVSTSGAAKAYTKDPLDSDNVVLETYELEGLSGGGSLCNDKLRVQEPEGAAKAFSLKNSFIFNPGDYRFNQTNVFVNAAAHADWIKALPAAEDTWYSPFIVITLDGSKQGQNNTAVYLPAKTGPTATIKLGQGDNKELANLQFDADVISHEMGHHIIYRTLKSTQGQALVIHEALADFFVFARTGNPCLGETICPASSHICLSTKCLRSGKNTLNFLDADLPTEGHKRSQLVSGLLWDLGEGLGQVKVANIVYHAVNYLTKEAGYLELIIALMKSDVDLNNGTNSCTIKNAADARGFKELLSEINCDEFK